MMSKMKQSFKAHVTAKEQDFKWVISPENEIKAFWDICVFIILIVSCILTPLQLAIFPGDFPSGHVTVNYIIDSMFLIDIIVIFNTAIYNEDYEIVKDRDLIAAEYLGSWFALDFITIIPFDLIFKSGSGSNMLRMARIGRINKILKLMKLMRLMKMQKSSSTGAFAFF
jgi:hypothetical protein